MGKKFAPPPAKKSPPDKKFLTPPEIAERLRTGNEQVLQYIHRGELLAVNLSLGTRPRWKVLEDDLDAFIRSRQNGPTVTPQRRITLPKAKRNYLDE